MYKVRVLVTAAVVLALAACPLPFQFTPEESDGAVAASNDPANPSMTAPPTLTIQESTSGEPVDSEPNTITARKNITIGFQSETRGAAIFYTTDGSRPVPGQDGTTRFSSDAPIVYDADGEGATVKAIAIGPSMYPSPVTERIVTVDYPAAGAPSFDPAPGIYSSDQSVTLNSTTAGATIYYTVADGMDGAPTPVPGQAGTLVYSGPISVAGAGTSTSIAAIAVAAEAKNSSVSSGVYSIGFTGIADTPVFSLRDGIQGEDVELEITSASSGAVIYYTVATGGASPADPVPGDEGTFVYGGPIRLSITSSNWRDQYRFKAIATGGGFLPSEISSANYVVVPRITVTDLYDDYPQYGEPRTIREAVMAWNNPSNWWSNVPRPDWVGSASTIVIDFDPAINGGNPFTITFESFNSDQITIQRNLVISGFPYDPDRVTISGSGERRVFGVGNPDRVSIDVSFRDITIADGLAQGDDGVAGPQNGGGGGGGAGVGGAMYIRDADVTVEGVVFRGNRALGGNGGRAGGVTAGQWGAPGVSGGSGTGFDGPTSPGGGGTAGGVSVPGGAGNTGSWLAGGGSGGSAQGDADQNEEPGAGGGGGFGGGGGGGGARRRAGRGAAGGSGGSYAGRGGTGITSGAGGGGGGAGLGGAIFVEGGALTVLDSEFRGNSAEGGDRGRNYQGAGTTPPGPGQGQGGAIFLFNGTYVDVGDNDFVGNRASDGSADVYEMPR